MQTAYIYSRVSSSGQKDNYSIEQQIKACRELATRSPNNYKILKVFKDEGRSATCDNRPSFLDMIDECKKGKVNAIFVYHTDRFARNESDHLIYKAILKQAGVKLISVMQPMLDDTPEGHLMDIFITGINAYYSRDLSRKTKRGMLGRWDTGWWPSWAPLGYVNITKNGKIGGKRHIDRQSYFDDLKVVRQLGLIEVDPIYGPLITSAFEHYGTGNYSLSSLSKLLSTKGLKNSKGKRLSVSALQTVLSNPFYYGQMRWAVGTDDDGNVVYEDKIGMHTPLVSYELFRSCQYVAAKHRQFLTRNRKHKFLLSGFIYCPEHTCMRKASIADRKDGSETYVEDNRRFTAEIKRNLNSKSRDSIVYYRCTNNEGGCKRSYIEAEKLELLVAKQIKKYEFKPEFINLVRGQIRERFDESKTATKSRIQALVNSKSAIELNQGKLLDAYIDGAIDKDALKLKQKEYTTNIARINSQIVDLNSQLKVDSKAIEEVIALTQNIYQSYMDAPDFIKRHYLRLFFERLYVRDGKITKVIANPVFEALRKQQQVLITRSWLPTPEILSQCIDEVIKAFESVAEVSLIQNRWNEIGAITH